MNNYYTIKKYIKYLYDSSERKYGFKAKNIEEHENWKYNLKNKLISILGIDKMENADLNFKLSEMENCFCFVRKKAFIQTKPNVIMPFYILEPNNYNGACVIAVHGHGSDGKNGISGVVKEETKENIKRFDCEYAIELVKRGFTVFCPDLCGSGERREEKQQGVENILKSSCTDINNAAISVGITLSGIITHDLLRLVDFITKSEYYKGKLAVCGFSGGGLSSLYIGALDERINAVAVSGYYHGFRDSILENNLCGCNFVPDLWKIIDVCDLGAMIAPKPLIIESAVDDKLNGKRGIEDVYEQVNITKKAYDLYGKELKHNVFKGGHKWYGSAYNFLEDWSVKDE